MIAWLRRLVYHAFGDAPDPALKEYRFAVKPRTEWRYDEALAIAGARRARRRSATGKPLPKPRVCKLSAVTDIRSRRQG